jgi:hypothetical protein
MWAEPWDGGFIANDLCVNVGFCQGLVALPLLLRHLALCQHCVVQNGTRRTRSMGWCLGVSSSDTPALGAVLMSELEIGEY